VNIAADNCIEENKNDINYIKLAYRWNGEAFADPDECHARPGSTVIWLLPNGVGTEFRILFDKDGGRTPDVRDTKEFVGSGTEKTDLKAILPVIRTLAKGEERKFRYSIESNGKKVDPSIIIDQ
jgi:hypothetical protein